MLPDISKTDLREEGEPVGLYMSRKLHIGLWRAKRAELDKIETMEARESQKVDRVVLGDGRGPKM